jgi:CBS-domain-containing membrane protein
MSIESVTISSIMVKEVKTAKENQSIRSVAKIMTDNKIGSVVIVNNSDTSDPVGIITERDIVRIVGAEQVLTLQMPVRDVMSKPVVTMGPNQLDQGCTPTNGAEGHSQTSCGEQGEKDRRDCYGKGHIQGLNDKPIPHHELLRKPHGRIQASL